MGSAEKLKLQHTMGEGREYILDKTYIHNMPGENTQRHGENLQSSIEAIDGPSLLFSSLQGPSHCEVTVISSQGSRCDDLYIVAFDWSINQLDKKHFE